MMAVMTLAEQTSAALEEAVRLLQHYAKLLNGYDGGMRVVPKDADGWLARLRELAFDRLQVGDSLTLEDGICACQVHVVQITDDTVTCFHSPDFKALEFDKKTGVHKSGGFGGFLIPNSFDNKVRVVALNARRKGRHDHR
jgi:hypothetical protein